MNKKAMGQIAAVNKLVACACAATSILLLARPVFADGCLQRNMPGSPDSEASSPCGCQTAGKDSAEVKDDCIKIVLGVGETTPWTGSRDVALKVFADDESPMVFTPYSLYAICGYTFKRIGNAVMADGSTPKEVVFSHPNGEPVKFVFAEGESLGRPDPGVHVPMDERLQMVDAEGWATAHDPVYWDLYMEDGRVRRYVATDMNGERGRFVSETDPHGRVVTPEDMGLDIVYDLNGVRQLLTPSRLADVQAFSNGYDVCVYAIQDVPARDAATGLYSVPSSAPYRVLTVRGENGGKRAVVTLKTGESEARTYIFDYVMGDWSLKRPNGVEERKERIVVDGRAAFLAKTVVSPSGERLARSEMNYKWESWGFAMTNKVEGFGSATRTTSWTFWTSGGGKGKLKTRLEQSGLLTSYDYDGQGRKAAETRSGPDMMTEVTTCDYSPVDPSDPVLPVDTRPRTIIRKLNNIECERTYYVYSPLTNIVERVGTQGAAYGGTNVLRTVTTFYPVSVGASLRDARSGFVASIRHEDGKLDLYDYELASSLWVRTVTHLHEQSPAPVSGKTTRDITITNARGEEIEARTEAYIDGIWYTIARSRMTYNAEGKRTSIENLAGQVTTTAWDCCHKVLEVQPDGSTTTWDYDDEGRIIASSRLIPLDMTNVTWLTTCYEYDALGRQTATWQTNYAAQVGLPVECTRYDQLGRVIARIDKLGNTTTTSYSNSGRVQSVTNANTSTVVHARNPNGDTLSIAGSAVTPEFHTYGITNLCVAATTSSPITCRVHETRIGSANSARFTKRYENLLGQTIREERSGFKGAVLATTHTYDALGRRVSTFADYEPTVEYIYDATGARSASVRRADGQWRKTETSSGFTLDDGNIWLTQTNIVSCSDSTIAHLVSSSSRQLTGLTSALPARSRSTDTRDNVTENEVHVSVPVVTSSQIVSYATNRPLTVSRYGVEIQSVSVSAVTNTVTYDALGRQIANTDGRGNTRHTEYNSFGQRVASIDALGNRITYTYDQFGNLTSVTDPLGNATIYEYNLRGNKVLEYGATYPVRYTYDIFGNKTSMTTFREGFVSDASASGDTTTWLYDIASGAMTNKVYADGKGPTYSYTPDGKLAQRTWARGIVTDYFYDNWGSLTNTVYSDNTPTVSLTYDALGRQTEAQDAAGITTFLYDSFGSVTNETVIGVAGTNTIIRHWDNYGRSLGYSLVGLAVPSEPHRQSTLAYDPATGRLASMQIPSEQSNNPNNQTIKQFSWNYLPGSDLKSSLAYPNGLTASWQYDANYQLLQVSNAFPTNVISQYDYAYDAAGRRVQITRSGAAMSETRTDVYGYNARSELVSASKLGGSQSSATEYAYSYDDIGNRITSLDLGTNRVYSANALNQYSSITTLTSDVGPQTSSFSPQFDDDGNQTLIKTSTGIWSVTYNGENRPTFWTCIQSNNSNNTNNQTISMSYDRMGRRVTKNDQRFVYDGYLCIKKIEYFTAIHYSLSPIHYFIWDPTEPVATRPLVWNCGASTSYYTHDGNKNVSEVIAENGDIAAHYEYAPFGAAIAQHGSSASSNPWRFSSEYAEDETATLYYNYRHYESVMGRWMNLDIIEEEGGINLYAFVDNDPCNHTDYLGMGQSSMIECGGNCKICLDNDAGSGDGNVYKIHWACSNNRMPSTCRQGDRTGSARLPDWLPSHGTTDVPRKIKDCVEKQTKWVEKAIKVPIPVPRTKCCKDVEFKTYEPTFPSLPNYAPQPVLTPLTVLACFGLVFLAVLLIPAGI
jgi:RHS repeat-associated protein